MDRWPVSEAHDWCGQWQQAAAVAPPEPAPVGSLVERVGHAIASADEQSITEYWTPEARAAIREVAAWMRENEISFHAAYCLDREVKR